MPNPAHRKKDDYMQVDVVPDGIKWKPAQHRPLHALVFLSTPGNIYKLIRVIDTGEVTYYKLKDADDPGSSKEKIDAEPKRVGQVRYRKNALCWFVDNGSRWYLVRVVDRTGPHNGMPSRIVLKSENGWDADRKSEWPYGELLEFPAMPNNPMFMRLRPLKARYQ